MYCAQVQFSDLHLAMNVAHKTDPKMIHYEHIYVLALRLRPISLVSPIPRPSKIPKYGAHHFVTFVSTFRLADIRHPRQSHMYRIKCLSIPPSNCLCRANLMLQFHCINKSKATIHVSRINNPTEKGGFAREKKNY